MSTELLTVNEDDLASMATQVMKWKNIHHVPVEDNQGKFTGLLTWTHMKRQLEKGQQNDLSHVSDIMKKEAVTVAPDSSIGMAISLMKRFEIGCLPVVQDRQLVGIITIKDVIPFDHADGT
jgi:predicted transcriptional regulator